MISQKVEIVLDADVIIHFAKGGLLHLIPDIFPEYDIVVLDIVKKEIMTPALTQLENQIALLKNIREVKFGDTMEEKREFARLTSVLCLGRGESASIYYGIQRKLISKSDAEEFVDTVNSKGSRLPKVDFDRYSCSKL